MMSGHVTLEPVTLKLNAPAQQTFVPRLVPPEQRAAAMATFVAALPNLPATPSARKAAPPAAPTT